MTTRSETAQPRVLPALQIPAIDITGRGGLGHADLGDPQRPVPMFAVKAAGTRPGDYVELFWDQRVIRNFVVPDDEQPTLAFAVPPLDIPDQPEVAAAFYRITTLLGGNQDDSPVRQVRVKRSVPGDPDPVNTTPTINEHLLPPLGVPTEIHEARDLTLTVPPWPLMHEGDVLPLYWGRSQYAVRNEPLRPEQIGQSQTLVVPAALQLAAGPSERLMVNYDIRDRVDNWSLYSLAVFSNVDIDPSAPAAPQVLEADPLSGELDLAQLAEQPVHVQIPAYTGIAKGDWITLHWLGEVGGEPVIPGLAPQEVDDPQLPPLFVVPNAAVSAIADGIAVVYFDVQPANGAPRRSRSTTVLVKGYPLLLPQPEVEHSSHYRLDPLKVQDGARVRVRYTHMNAGQQISLQWDGRPDIAQPAEQPGSASGEVSFDIPPAAVAQAMGKYIDVLYRVTRRQQSDTSEGLRIVVLGFPDNDTGQVQGPRILQAADDRHLDVSRLTADADLSVKAWPFIARGQKIRLSLTGTLADGSPWHWPHPQWQDLPIQSTEDLHTQVPLELLKNLKDGSELRLLFEVSFDAGASRVALPARALRVSQVAAVNGHESWEASRMLVLPPGQAVEFSHGLRVTASGETAEIRGSGFYPEFGSRLLIAGADETLKFDFSGLIRSLIISHQGGRLGRNTLRFHDREGATVQTVSLVSQASVACQPIELERPCSGCELVLSSNTGDVVIDNLIWRAVSEPGATALAQDPQSPPAIWRVFDPQGNYLPDGAETGSTALCLEGSGEAASVVRLTDHRQLVMTASVNLGQSWSIPLEGLPPGEHQYRVMSPDDRESLPWRIRIREPLQIDERPMQLSGLVISAEPPWQRNANDSSGSISVREASGGLPPYRYHSLDERIASVDAQGKVSSIGNGQTEILVQDAAGDERRYPVQVRNVWKLLVNEGPFFNGNEALVWINGVPNGRKVAHADYINLAQRHDKPATLPNHYSTGTKVSQTSYFYYNSTHQQLMTTTLANNQVKGAWCLVPG